MLEGEVKTHEWVGIVVDFPAPFGPR